MPSLIDSMRQKADQAALEADKLVRIRREQGAIDQLRRDIKAQLDALGQAALAAYRASEIVHPQLVGICRQIEALNEQIRQREERIEQIRAEKLVTPPPAPPPLPPPAGPTVPCPNCGQHIPAEARFCPVCGYKIPPPAPAAALCAACGSPMPPTAQFCPTCGARRAPAPAPPPPPPPPPPQTIRCPGCGAELPAVAVFCPDCGTRIGATATPPMPPPPVAAPVTPEEPVGAEAAVAAPEPEAGALSPFDAPTEGMAPTELAEAGQGATKRCIVCQTELPVEAIFCPECGARQQAP